MTASTIATLNLSMDPHFFRVYSVRDCVVMETSCGTEGPSQGIYLTTEEAHALAVGLDAARTAVQTTQAALAKRYEEKKAIEELKRELGEEIVK